MHRTRQPKPVDTLTCSVGIQNGLRTKTLKVNLNSSLAQQAQPKRSYKEMVRYGNDDGDDERDNEYYNLEDIDNDEESDDEDDDGYDESEKIQVSTYIKRLVLTVYVGKRRVPNIVRMNIDSTVEDVKERITNKTGHDYFSHRLIFDRTTMEDDRTLTSYDIWQSAELRLIR